MEDGQQPHLSGPLAGFFPPDVSWLLLLPGEERFAEEGAGVRDVQEGQKEEGSLLSLTRSPRCRINRMEEGAAAGCWASGSRYFPECSWLSPK